MTKRETTILPRGFLMAHMILAMIWCGAARATEKSAVPQTDVDALSHLRAELDEAHERKSRVEILGKIAMLDSKVAKPFLLAYFKELPASQATTDVGRDIVKGAAFDAVLPLLKEKEREQFLSEVLEEDIKGWRKAGMHNAANMYPKIILRKLLEAYESDGCNTTVLNKLSKLSKDPRLPENARVLLNACVIRMKAGSEDAQILEAIRKLIADLPTRKLCVIPWEFADDKEKRIAYGKSEACQRQLAEVREWRVSGNSQKYETTARVLQSYREASIRELVAVIEQESVPREKRDSLAMLTGDLLAGISVDIKAGNITLGHELPELANRLALYVDKMDDPGLFSCRYDAEVGLSRFFRNVALPQYPFTSQRVMANHTTAVVTTNKPAALPVNEPPSDGSRHQR